MRASRFSISFSFNSFSRTSALAFSTSGFDGAAVEASALSAPESLEEESPSLLSEERPRFFFFFVRFRFFLSSEELEELSLLSLRGRFTEGLLRFRDRLRDRLPPASPPPFPSARCRNISRIAREPAWGESARRGGGGGKATGAAPSSRGRCALHLKHSKRLTKLRSPQPSQYQSRLRSSSSSFPPGIMEVGRRPLPMQPLPRPAEVMPPKPSGPRVIPVSVTGRKLRACSLPSGKRVTSKVTYSPARSDVCSAGARLSREK
mmetsp:Transcript_23240/g.65311  ORF Transcript_23240/g.65311 Transcript_23240/m.65311 type:complete len:262 (+) Transcript_23240:1113-1898(+)